MKIKLSQLRRLVKEEAQRVHEAGSNRRKMGYLRFDFYLDSKGELWMTSTNTVLGGEDDDPADPQIAADMIDKAIEFIETNLI